MVVVGKYVLLSEPALKLIIEVVYPAGRLRIYNSRKSKEGMHCLICDADVATHNGYNILYTVLPNGGSLLCDNINKVLRRDLDAVTARSTILCNRYLFFSNTLLLLVFLEKI